MRFRLSLAACAAFSFLSACGGGNDSETSTDPLPLKIGNRWVYQYTTSDPQSGISTYEVTGTRVIDGQTAYVIRDDFRQRLRDTPYVPRNVGVYKYPPSDTSPNAVVDRPVMVVTPELHTGDTWTDIDETVDSGYDIDDDGMNEVEVITSNSQVGAVVSVTTPARTFDEAYPVISLYQRQIVNPVTHEVYDTASETTRQWHVPGIGVVRREVDIQFYGNGTFRDFSSTEVLQSARLYD